METAVLQPPGLAPKPMESAVLQTVWVAALGLPPRRSLHHTSETCHAQELLLPLPLPPRKPTSEKSSAGTTMFQYLYSAPGTGAFQKCPHTPSTREDGEEAALKTVFVLFKKFSIFLALHSFS